ncbi:MAG: hypothetical protein KH301_00870 [Brachyspira sp.]|nr:hypothetical protein [Brachyspira sp.]
MKNNEKTTINFLLFIIILKNSKKSFKLEYIQYTSVEIKRGGTGMKRSDINGFTGGGAS